MKKQKQCKGSINQDLILLKYNKKGQTLTRLMKKKWERAQINKIITERKVTNDLHKYKNVTNITICKHWIHS